MTHSCKVLEHGPEQAPGLTIHEPYVNEPVFAKWVRRTILSALFLVANFAWVLPATAAGETPTKIGLALPPTIGWDTVVSECIERFFERVEVPVSEGSVTPPLPPPPEPLEIVLGCRFPNCGSPTTLPPTPIEVHVSITGDLAESVRLDIENVSPKNAGGIRITEKNKDDNLIPIQMITESGEPRLRAHLPSAETHTIRNLVVTPDTRPPTLILQPFPNRSKIDDLNRQYQLTSFLNKTHINGIGIVVQQFLGKLKINEKRIWINFRFCRLSPKHSEDQVLLENSGTTSSTVLLNGRRQNGCINAIRKMAIESHIGSDIVYLDNVLSNRPCYSEASIFLRDHAMRLKIITADDPTWTDAPTDRISVDMYRPPLSVPVNIWIFWPDDEASSREEGGRITLNKAQTNLQEVNAIFNTTQSGIQFFMPNHSPQLRVDEAEELNLLQATCDDVDVQKETLRSKNSYIENQLNVYYVGYPPQGEQATGWHCITSDPNVIILRSAISLRATLAHEMGHALSLQQHSDGDSLKNETDENEIRVFDDTNIMKATFSSTSVDNRSKLTKGQSFRANVSGDSALYRVELPDGSILDTTIARPGRSDCNDLAISITCPRIGAD